MPAAFLCYMHRREFLGQESFRILCFHFMHTQSVLAESVRPTGTLVVEQQLMLYNQDGGCVGSLGGAVCHRLLTAFGRSASIKTRPNT